MLRDRLLVPAALLGGALIGLGLLRRGSHEVAAAGEAPAATQEFEGERSRLFADLARFRSGDDAQLSALRERAARICERWQRCDVVDVVEYYARLERAARLQGVEDERRVLAQYERASHAHEDRLDEQDWQIEREALLSELEDLGRASQPSADRVPAAQAAALAAHLRVERLLDAEELDLAELEALDRDLALSLEVFVQAGMRLPRIELDWIHGRRALSLGRPDEAEADFERCLENARTFGQLAWQQSALRELHELAQQAGDVPLMHERIGELAALDTSGLSWEVARSHVGQLFWEDQSERAADFLRAHRPESAGPAADEHALLLGQCLLRMGDAEGALSAYAGIAATSPQSRPARLAEARALLARGSPADALARVESVGAGRAGAELRDTWLTLHAEILLALGRRAQAIRELREALEGAARAQARLFAGRDGERTTNVFGEVLGLHTVALLARAELDEGDALGAACTIESAQSSRLRFARGGAALSRGDLAAWAKRFELGLATWVVGADESLVVLVAPDGSARGERIPHGRRTLQEAVRRLREAVLSGDEPRRARLGRELGAVLLPGALRDELVARAGTRPARLCFLLHGPLEALPLESLEDGAWLSETIVPLVLPGLPGSAPGEEWDAASQRRWQLLGDPCGSEGEPLLAGAREELEGVARILPGAALAIGANFDRERLCAALASGDCLHIATHVRHGGGPARARTDEARFVLSGGAELDLSEVARRAPHAPLVVLTGCETGGGRFADAEGLQGLARAFLEGGTRNLVATGWPVEDRWAQAFALALQRALAKGSLPSHAAAEARRSLRAQGAPAAEWAAFRLLGQD